MEVAELKKICKRQRKHLLLPVAFHSMTHICAGTDTLHSMTHICARGNTKDAETKPQLEHLMPMIANNPCQFDHFQCEFAKNTSVSRHPLAVARAHLHHGMLT